MILFDIFVKFFLNKFQFFFAKTVALPFHFQRVFYTLFHTKLNSFDEFRCCQNCVTIHSTSTFKSFFTLENAIYNQVRKFLHRLVTLNSFRVQMRWKSARTVLFILLSPQRAPHYVCVCALYVLRFVHHLAVIVVFVSG